jgi:hypothetical protein
MRRCTPLAALAGVLLTALAPVAPAWAAPANGQIAYVRPSVGAGDPEVWLANQDGTNRRRVLSQAKGFRWSKDGMRVSYLQFNRVTGVDVLYVAAGNLTGRKSLGSGWSSADWTTDGTALTAVRPLGAHSELFLKPVSGAAATRLTRAGSRGCDVRDPDVGPAGVTYLVDCLLAAKPTVEVHTAKLTGGVLTTDTAVVTATIDPFDPAGSSYRIDAARWRANGRILLGGCVAPDPCSDTNIRSNLYEYASGALTRLTSVAPGGTGTGWTGVAPAPVGAAVVARFSNASVSRLQLRPSGAVVDPLGEGAEDWQPLLAP